MVKKRVTGSKSPVSTTGRQPQQALTAVELEIMTIVWRLGEGTVRDVMAALPADRPLAYTSVSTMLRILEQKGIVASRPATAGGVAHLYAPRISKEAYEGAALRELVAKVFDNTPEQLVARLLDEKSLSKDDLERIKKLVEERLAP
jgi:predicted transcriptional regulator